MTRQGWQMFENMRQPRRVALAVFSDVCAVETAICVHVDLSRHVERLVLTIDENNEIVGRI